jgi:hypothetical protein
VADKILCRELPVPPEGVDTNPPKIDAARTTRQRYEALTETPGSVCASCHKSINPAGYAFEHLDPIGKVRRDENKVAINTIVDVTGAADVDGHYANVGELGQKLAMSAAARECLARQIFRYAGGRTDAAADKPAIDEMMGAFSKGAWNIRELFVSHVLSERFVTRRAGN